MSTGAQVPGWRLGVVAGVPVYVARSWLLIAALLVFLFGPQVAAGQPGLGALAYVIALGYPAALFVAVLVHEVAHAVAARALGLPATHIVITFWGGHTQFETQIPSPGRSVLVAVVGPLANGLLALGGWTALALVPAGGGLARVLLAFVLMNAFLAVFNLLPGLPMDGGHILEAVVWRLTGARRTGTLVAGWAGRVVAVLAVGLALLPLLDGRSPQLLTVVWAALVGSMLWSAAGQAIKGAKIFRRAANVDLRTLMQPAIGVPAGVTAEQLADLARRHAGEQAVAVLGPSGSVIGLVDPGAVSAVPERLRSEVRVEALARIHDPRAVLDAGLTGEHLISRLERLPGSQIVVLESGRVVGVLAVDALLAQLMGARR